MLQQPNVILIYAFVCFAYCSNFFFYLAHLCVYRNNRIIEVRGWGGGGGEDVLENGHLSRKICYYVLIFNHARLAYMPMKYFFMTVYLFILLSY